MQYQAVLLTASFNGLFLSPPQISHTFSNYPPGVRHILFQHGGKDTQFWKGWYGPRVTNSSIIVSHRTAKNPAPARTLPEEGTSNRRKILSFGSWEDLSP